MTLHRITSLFPLWVFSCSVLSLFFPQIFTWFSGNFITFGLSMIMLGMGITLSVDDFKNVLLFPWRVFVGVILQYTIMPLSAYAVAKYFSFPPEYAAGLILVGTCPGGTASNVITYIARANVALSVTLTAISTLISVIMTPLLSAVLIGNRVEVSVTGLFLGTMQVVIIPVTLGIVANRYFHKSTQKLQPYAPVLAVVMIVMIVASIIGSSRNEILASGAVLLSAVFIFHAIGFFWGYVASRLIFHDENTARTISIEVGMQNSGLAVFLATANFSNPLVAIPGAISSLIHSLIGSFLAGIWRKKSRIDKIEP